MNFSDILVTEQNKRKRKNKKIILVINRNVSINEEIILSCNNRRVSVQLL